MAAATIGYNSGRDRSRGVVWGGSVVFKSLCLGLLNSLLARPLVPATTVQVKTKKIWMHQHQQM